MNNIKGSIGEKKEYRQWNPFRSKLGAAILVNLLLLLYFNRVVLVIFIWDLVVKFYILVLLLVLQFLMSQILFVMYNLII